jgi:hypothetical protein
MKIQRKVCLIEYKEIKGYNYLLLACNLIQICKLKPYFESFIYHKAKIDRGYKGCSLEYLELQQSCYVRCFRALSKPCISYQE